MTDAAIILGIDGRPAQQGAQVVKSALDGVKTASRDTTATVKKTTTAFEEMKQSLFGVKGALGALGATLSAREIIKYSDTWKQLEGRLSIVTTGMSNLRDVQQRLFTISQNTRASFEATSILFTKLATSANNLGKSQSDMLRFTELVNKGLVVSGASAGEAASAIRQLSQAMASGVLRGDEFNSIMENSQTLQKAIADNLETTSGKIGVTTGRLRQMAEQGQLTAKKVFEAVERAGTSIDEKFAKIPLTVGQSLQQLDNAFLKYIGQNSAINQGTSSIALTISKLADNFDVLADTVVVFGGIYATRFIANMVTGIAVTTQNTVAEIANAAAIERAALAASAGARWQAALAAQTRAATGAIAAETIVVGATGTAVVATGSRLATMGALASRAGALLLGAFGGPVGLAIAAVSVAIWAVVSAEDSAAEAAAKHKTAIDDLKSSRDLLDGSYKNGAQKVADEAKAHIDNAKAILQEADAEAKLLKAKLANPMFDSYSLDKIGTTPARDQATAELAAKQKIIADLQTEIAGAQKDLDKFIANGNKAPGDKPEDVQNLAKKTIALKGYDDELKKSIALAQQELAGAKVSALQQTINKVNVEASAKAHEDYQKKVRATNELTAQETEYYKKQATALYEATYAKTKYDESRDLAKSAFDDTRTAAEKLNIELKKLQEAKSFVKDEDWATAAEQIEGIDRAMVKLRDDVNPMAKIFEDVATSINTSVKDAIRDMLDGPGGFKKMKDRVVDMFKDMLAQLLALRIANPIIIPMIASIGGAIGLGAGSINAVAGQLGGSSGVDYASGASSGISGLLNGFNNPIFGAGSFVGGAIDKIGGYLGIGGAPIPGGIGPSPGLSASFTPGAALAGFGGNFLANSIFGGNRGIGASIGGMAGGIGGTLATPAITAALAMTPLAPLAPFIGPALGSFLGNALGGLFGGKPSDKTMVATVNLQTGAMNNDHSSSGNKFSQENLDSANSFAALAQAMSQSIANVTGETIKKSLSIVVGSRDGLRILDNSTGVQTNYGSNPGDLIKGIAQTLISSLTEVPKSLATAMDHIDFSKPEQALKDFAFALSFDNLDKKVEEVSQYKQAIDDLNKQFDEAADTAKRLGLEEAKVETARQAQLQYIKDAFNSSITNQILSITDPAKVALSELSAEYKKNKMDAIAVGGSIYDVEVLYLTKKKMIEDQMARDSAQAQLTLLQEQTQAQQDAISANISIYQAQQQAASQALTQWQRLGDDISDTIDNILSDPALSPLAPEQRVAMANGNFDDLLSKALGGDPQAFDDLKNASVELLKVQKQYAGATVPYFETFEKVKTGLQAARDVAVGQQNIAAAQLNVANSQLDALTAQQNTLNQMLAALQKQANTPTTTPDPVLPPLPAPGTPFDGSVNLAIAKYMGAPFSTTGHGEVSDWLIRNPSKIAEYDNLRGMYQPGFKTNLATNAYGIVAGGQFNEAKYLAAYPDVAQAVARGLYSSGAAQYLSVGYTQGRSAFTYAKGGLAQGLSWVGEQGPELVNFQNPTMVYPADVSNKIMSGAASNDNVAVVENLEKLVARMEQMMRQSAAESQMLLAAYKKSSEENEELRAALLRTATK